MGTLVLNGATSGSTTLSPVDGITATVTLPLITSTVATLAGTETLSNKTLTSPIINTPSASGQVYSGTYTPTLTGVANVDATTAFSCRYWRMGNQVMVSGRMNLDTTSGAPTSTGVRISLPIPSNFGTAATDCSGVGASDTASAEAWGILADTVNDEALLSGASYQNINRAVYFNFTYTII